MKKNKLILGVLLSYLATDTVLAASTSTSTNNSSGYMTFGYIIFGSMIALGFFIVIYDSVFKKDDTVIYIEKEKNKIAGLTDKDKLDKKNSFNADSIFKTIPTFSRNKFIEGTSKSIISLLDKDKKEEFSKVKENFSNEELITKNKDELSSVKVTNFEIINFICNEDEKIIKSMIHLEHKKEKNKKETLIYEITSSNKNKKNIEMRCPNCGGKIKDSTRLRCNFCGSIYPSLDKTDNDKWIITEINKK